MVDGVLASCYASFDHDLAHALMAPLRWLPEVTERIFGVDRDSAGYVNIAKQLGRYILPYDQLYRATNF